MSIPKKILKIERPKNTIVKFNKKSNTYYVVKRTSKRVEGKKNPIPVEIGVIGKIENDKFIEFKNQSNDKIDILSDGCFKFYDKFSTSYFSVLSNYFKESSYIYSLIYLSIINNSTDISTLNINYLYSSISLKYKNNSFDKKKIMNKLGDDLDIYDNFLDNFKTNISFNLIYKDQLIVFNRNLLPISSCKFDEFLINDGIYFSNNFYNYEQFGVKYIALFDDYSFIETNKLTKNFTNQLSFNSQLIKYKVSFIGNYYYYSYKIGSDIIIYKSNIKLDPVYLYKNIYYLNNTEYYKFIINGFNYSDNSDINNRINLLIQLFYNNLNNIIITKKSNFTLFYIFNYLSKCCIKSGTKVYTNWKKCGLYNSESEILKLL